MIAKYFIPVSVRSALYVLLAIGSILPSLVRADTSTGTTFTTIANSQCSVWTERRAEALSETTFGFAASWSLEGWILGSISTLNALSHGQPNVLKAIDARTVHLWVDRYCAKYPNKDLLDASFELFVELEKIQAPKSSTKERNKNK